MVASAQQRPPSPPPLPPHHHDDEHAVEGYDEGADATTSAAVKAATTAAGSSNAIHAPATSSASSQHDANAELIASWDPEQLAKIVEAAVSVCYHEVASNAALTRLVPAFVIAACYCYGKSR